jgi:hypothetical protein
LELFQHFRESTVATQQNFVRSRCPGVEEIISQIQVSRALPLHHPAGSRFTERVYVCYLPPCGLLIDNVTNSDRPWKLRTNQSNTKQVSHEAALLTCIREVRISAGTSIILSILWFFSVHQANGRVPQIKPQQFISTSFLIPFSLIIRC